MIVMCSRKIWSPILEFSCVRLIGQVTLLHSDLCPFSSVSKNHNKSLSGVWWCVVYWNDVAVWFCPEFNVYRVAENFIDSSGWNLAVHIWCSSVWHRRHLRYRLLVSKISIDKFLSNYDTWMQFDDEGKWLQPKLSLKILRLIVK